jgi:hypothetical protein
MYGFTTPSVTNVMVVGDTGLNHALGVVFAGEEAVWFDPGLVETIDANAGAVIEVGGERFVRLPSGEWCETTGHVRMSKPRRKGGDPGLAQPRRGNDAAPPESALRC